MANILDNVLYDIRAKIERQNFSLSMYGLHSYEFQVARIILNTTLETLKECDYIHSFVFTAIVEGHIENVILYMGVTKISISEKEVLYL